MATVSKRRWRGKDGKANEGWRVGYFDQNGKRRFKQFATKKAADTYALTVEMEKRHGVHVPDADSVTVKDAGHIWLGAAAAAGCDRSTLKTYKEILECHIVPLLGTEKLTRLTGPKVVAFADALLQARSHSIARKGVRHLSMMLGEAQRRGLVGQNVARGVKVRRPRGEDQKLAKRAEIPPMEHLRAMIEAADRLTNEDPRLAVMIRIAMLTGLRASEMRALPWRNVDLKELSLRVTQRADRWNEIGPPKSKAGHRIIPIGPALATTLKAWKLRCPPSELGLVFPSRPQGRPTGTFQAGPAPIAQHSMATLLLKVQVAAGVAIDTGKRDAKHKSVWALRYDWHHLRHVAASSWIADGIDAKRLMTWIGHENVALTIEVYGHLMADAKKDAALAAGAEAALLS